MARAAGLIDIQDDFGELRGLAHFGFVGRFFDGVESLNATLRLVAQLPHQIGGRIGKIGRAHV